MAVPARTAACAAPRSSRQPCRRLRTMTPACSLTLTAMIEPPPLPQPMPVVVLELRGVSQAYGKRVAVKGVSLKLRRGDIGCLLGPSGCGKTSLLRTIAGFEPVVEGEVRLNGEIASR